MNVLLVGSNDAPHRMGASLLGSPYRPVFAVLDEDVPGAGDAAFGTALREAADRRGAEWIVPTCPASAHALGVALAAGVVERRRVPLADPCAPLRLDDRRAVLGELRRRVPSARVACPGEIGWDRVVPGVLRSRFASSDRGARVLDDLASVEPRLGLGDRILEPYRPEGFVVVEVVMDRAGDVSATWVTRRSSREAGRDSCRVQVRAHAVRACEALRLIGAATVYLRDDALRGPVVMDVRPHLAPGGAHGPLRHLLDLASWERGPSPETTPWRPARRLPASRGEVWRQVGVA